MIADQLLRNSIMNSLKSLSEKNPCFLISIILKEINAFYMGVPCRRMSMYSAKSWKFIISSPSMSKEQNTRSDSISAVCSPSTPMFSRKDLRSRTLSPLEI